MRARRSEESCYFSRGVRLNVSDSAPPGARLASLVRARESTTIPSCLQRITVLPRRGGQPGATAPTSISGRAFSAFGAGGVEGVGLGAGRQQMFSSCPRPIRDFIFAIVGEELGLVFTLGGRSAVFDTFSGRSVVCQFAPFAAGSPPTSSYRRLSAVLALWAARGLPYATSQRALNIWRWVTGCPLVPHKEA